MLVGELHDMDEIRDMDEIYELVRSMAPWERLKVDIHGLDSKRIAPYLPK